ncbi:uncharacterized protein LOC120345223 isoform X2 [Styela clava]
MLHQATVSDTNFNLTAFCWFDAILIALSFFFWLYCRDTIYLNEKLEKRRQEATLEAKKLVSATKNMGHKNNGKKRRPSKGDSKSDKENLETKKFNKQKLKTSNSKKSTSNKVENIGSFTPEQGKQRKKKTQQDSNEKPHLSGIAATKLQCSARYSSGDLADQSSSDSNKNEPFQEIPKQKKTVRRQRRTSGAESSVSFSLTSKKNIDFSSKDRGYFEFKLGLEGGAVKLPFCKLEFPPNSVEREMTISVKPVYTQCPTRNEKNICFLTSAIFFKLDELLEKTIKIRKPVHIFLATERRSKGTSINVIIQKASDYKKLNWEKLTRKKITVGKYIECHSRLLCGFRAVTFSAINSLLTLYKYIVYIKRPTNIIDPLQQILVIKLYVDELKCRPSEILLEGNIYARHASNLELTLNGNKKVNVKNKNQTFTIPDINGDNESLEQDICSFCLEKCNPDFPISQDMVVHLHLKIKSEDDSKPSNFPFYWSKDCTVPPIHMHVSNGGTGMKNEFYLLKDGSAH